MIRDANPNDYKQIFEILKAEGMINSVTKKRFLNSFGKYHKGKEFRNLPYTSERWFVAENAEKVVGTSYCFWGSIYGYIGKVAVEKEYRRKRIGSDLMKKTIDFLKDQGVASIHAVVRTGEEENLVFFERFGFKYHDLYLMDAKLDKRTIMKKRQQP